MITVTIPGIPPSVNHYVKHTRAGRHYKTKDCDRFLWAMKAMLNESHRIRGKAYAIAIVVYLGKGDRRDWDNCPKTVCDGLVTLGIIDSDAKIRRGTVELRRDPIYPRTVISLDVIEEPR